MLSSLVHRRRRRCTNYIVALCRTSLLLLLILAAQLAVCVAHQSTDAVQCSASLSTDCDQFVSNSELELKPRTEEIEEGGGEVAEKEAKMSMLNVARVVGATTVRSVRNTMAWRSSASSNAALVSNLKRNGLFSDERVEKAILEVDRGDFTDVTPYGDHPVAIGYGATISAPHMHAMSLELLKDHLKEGSRALDVGSGSGYLSACMSLMVGETGKVVGVEHIQQLVDMSKENINKNHAKLLSDGRIEIIKGDGRKGYADGAPYNAIHVGAAAPQIPQMLIEQLANGGRMLIPVGSERGSQRFVQVDKDTNGQIKDTNLMDVIYVPLTDEEDQVRN